MKLKSWASIMSMAVSGIVAGEIERVGAMTIIYDGAAGTTPNSYTSNPSGDKLRKTEVCQGEKEKMSNSD
ncbi:hypothetical protein [Chamaesiphon sp.]|uniref:hypothetical protein n=1 Tax=Chamaesiphon sp. TaxID=2814140 RepID=UPI00359303BE